jgi:hypothetical protein
MAAETKVVIRGDASQAEQALEKFIQSTDRVYGKLGKLRTELEKVDFNFGSGKADLKDLQEAQSNYTKVLLNNISAIKKTNSETEATKKVIKLLTSELRDLYAYAEKAEVFGPISDAMTTLETHLDEIIDKENKSKDLKKAKVELAKIEKDTYEKLAQAYPKETQSLQSSLDKGDGTKALNQAKEMVKLAKELEEETLKINKMTALNDKAGLMGVEYKKMEKELESILKAEGKVTEESKKLGQQMQVLKKRMDDASHTSLSERMKNLVKSFVSAQAVVYLIRKSINLLTNGLKEMASEASKAEETANLFNTTFSQIQSTASKTANTLASSLGMASATIQQSLGLFGDLAMGYGQSQSEALKFAETAVKTGLDIMSFKNIAGDTTEVLQTMASGLAGNFENFRKWGIIVTQAEIKTRLQQKGLDKLTGTALQYAKVQETLNIVQEKSVNAQGDMIKTLKSTENISRRLKEANKELMASMGKSINDTLNPIKEAWIGIVDQINKANRAQSMFAEGKPIEGVYDIANNKKDYKSFKNELGDSSMTWESNIEYFQGTGLETEMLAGAERAIGQLMDKFDASAQDVLNAYKELYGLDAPDWMKSAAEVFEKANKDAEQALSDSEQRLKTAVDLANSYYNLLDSLNSVTGVTVNGSISDANVPANNATDAGLEGYTAEVANATNEAIKQAIDSIKQADVKEFADVIGLAFGDETQSTMLDKKADALKSLYEALYNESLKDGEQSRDELKNLSQILDIYKSIRKEQEQITEAEKKKQEAQSKGASNLASVTSYANTAGDYSTKTKQIGMSDMDIALSDFTTQFETLQKAIKDSYAEGGISVIEYARAMTTLKKSFNEGQTAIEEYYKTLEEESYQSSFKGEQTEYQSRIDSYGKSERETEKDQILAKYRQEEADILVGLVDKYYDTIEAEEAQQKQLERLSTFQSQIADFGVQLDQMKMSDAEKSADDLRRQFAELSAELSTDSQEYKDLKKAYEDAVEASKKYYDALEAETELKKRQDEEEAYQKSFGDEKASLETSIATIGFDERQLALYKLANTYREAEKSILEDLVNEYYDKIEAHEKEAKQLEALKGFQEQISSFTKQVEQMDMSEAEKSVDNLSRQFFEIAAGMDAESEAYKNLLDAYEEAIEASNEYYEKLEAEAEAKKYEDDKGGYEKKIATFGMDNRQLALYEAMNTYRDEELSSMEGLINQYYDMVDAETNAATQAQLLNESLSSLGTLGTVISLFKNFSFGGLIGLIIKLISQLEIVKELGNFLTEAIIEPLNKFLKPFMPVLAAIVKIVQTLITTALEPIFPILKEVAKIIIFVLGIIQIAIGIVRDIGKKIVGTVQYAFMSIYNWFIRFLKGINLFGWRPFGGLQEADTTQAHDWMTTDVFGNARNTWDEMNDTLHDIDRMTMDIAENTDEDDERLDYLQELYNKNLIDEATYRGQLASITGQKFDLTKSFAGLSYSQPKYGQTAIYDTKYTITINGDGRNAKQIAEEVIKAIETKQRSGYNAYSA